MPEEKKMANRQDVMKAVDAAQQKLLDWLSENRITSYLAHEVGCQLAIARDRLNSISD